MKLRYVRKKDLKVGLWVRKHKYYTWSRVWNIYENPGPNRKITANKWYKVKEVGKDCGLCYFTVVNGENAAKFYIIDKTWKCLDTDKMWEFTGDEK